ncbi:MAG TPA: GtrA family protein [Eubacterium sp.]|nr:GtrA family protein [Eubacterium sp.]
MKKIIDLLKKYIFNREMIMYIIMGVLATVVNLIVYAISVKALAAFMTNKPLYIGVAKLIAWVVAVLFAFFTNKIWVFESKSWAPKVFWRELISFIGARVLTGLLEVFGTPFLVSIGLDQTLFGVEGLWAVIIISFIVIVANYVFSKLLIFTKKETH